MVSRPKTDRSMASSYRQRTTPWRSISSSMTLPISSKVGTNDLVAGTLHDQGFELIPHLGHVRRDQLAELIVVTQILGHHSLDQLLGLLHQLIQFLAGTQVEV